MQPKIGVLIYTYNRLDDARINMEIIRNVWSRMEMFKNVTIVHAYNGDTNMWKDKYLEDELIYCENRGHFKGAETLIDTGMKVFQQKYKDVDYVITLASDTWCVKPEYLEGVIASMKKDEKYLATCAWGNEKEDNMFNIGMSLDFFVIDKKWSRRASLFPIRYTEFLEKYEEVFMYMDKGIFLERVFAMRFKQAILKTVTIPSENLSTKITLAHVHRITEREPVHHDVKKLFQKPKGVRAMYWKSIGLLTQHDPYEKQKALREWSITLGEHSSRFLQEKDLGYFNDGLEKTTFTKGNTKIQYND